MTFTRGVLVVDMLSFCSTLENSSGGGGMTRGAVKELARLRKQNVQLAEENNLLKYKLEVMVDMVRKSLLNCSPFFFSFFYWEHS